MTELPIIGMSPGNSYFKDEVVKNLLQEVVNKYGKAIVMIADIPAVSTYIALGYPENRARRDKALPQGNALKNRSERAKNDLGYREDQVHIIDWENDVENNPNYRQKYADIKRLYENNEPFRLAADDATREVLEYSNKEILDFSVAVKIAVHYLLSEIAFMEFSLSYFNVDKSTYMYHRNWPVYERYIAGDFDGNKRTYLGFEIVKISI